MKERIMNSAILFAVATGTAMLSFMTDAAKGAEPVQTVFFVFVAAVIAVQLVPALMLIIGLIRKSSGSSAVRRQEN